MSNFKKGKQALSELKRQQSEAKQDLNKIEQRKSEAKQELKELEQTTCKKCDRSFTSKNGLNAHKCKK